MSMWIETWHLCTNSNRQAYAWKHDRRYWVVYALDRSIYHQFQLHTPV